MLYIDNVDFAKNNRALSGNLDAINLMRAAELFDELNGEVSYTIKGSIDNKNKPMLTIEICGKITTLCQNCMEKMEIPLKASSIVPIFYSENDLDQGLFGDEHQYDDGILADTNFDILNFVEDEVIMLLPLAPKHNRCKEFKHADKADSPFAALKQLLN